MNKKAYQRHYYLTVVKPRRRAERGINLKIFRCMTIEERRHIKYLKEKERKERLRKLKIIKRLNYLRGIDLTDDDLVIDFPRYY